MNMMNKMTVSKPANRSKDDPKSANILLSRRTT